MRSIVKICTRFLRKETVLCAAVILAVISCFFVPPNLTYLSYIDWGTLALLFSLMAVMKGFQKAGLFEYLGSSLLKKTSGSRGIMVVLVFLPFVFSMIITNDISLITFVPFGLIVLRLANMQEYAVRLVVLQTLAANLGSMLTPMGNPQNLYLYSRSGMGIGEFCMLMLPYVLVSGVCLALFSAVGRHTSIPEIFTASHLGSPRYLIFCALGFVICLLGIFNIISPLIIAALTAIFLLFTDRRLLAAVDYSLLGTFMAFFIFIGNLQRIDVFRNIIASLLEGHVRLIAVLSSQIISNVPAALMLSGFTDQWKELIIGCNLGGMGTMIASMASLISYKLFVKEYPNKRKRYFVWFTLLNLGMLALLFFLGWLLDLFA